MEKNDTGLTGGLQSLTMRRSSSLDGIIMETNVNIEPSAKISSNAGVFMQVNCHHPLIDLPYGHGSEQAMSLLSKRFDNAINEAESIIDAMIKLGKQQ